MQHLRPILRLGATGAGLNIDIGVTGIHLTGEHATELEASDDFFQLINIALQIFQPGFVAFFGEHFQQLVGVVEATEQTIKIFYHAFQLGPFTAQRLGAVGSIPDGRIFELTLDFGQTFPFARVVKDTPSTHLCVGGYRQADCAAD